MSLNLNRTLPAAAAGRVNGQWASDVSGNVSVSVPVSASELTSSSIDLTGQGANIAATTLLAAAPAGIYRISIHVQLTTPAGTSSTFPDVQIIYTEGDSGVSHTLTLLGSQQVAATTNTTAVFSTTTFVLNVSGATTIQYATVNYASNAGGAMKYSLHIRTESL